MQNIQILYKVPVMFVITCFWKHSNCLDFARSVSPSLWYAVPVFWIKSICTGFHVSHQKNFHIYIIFHQQCNSYLECYKKHNSFQLNKKVILKTFDSNIRVLFRGTYIRFDYKQRETCSETFFRTVFFENIKTMSLSMVIKIKGLYFCFNFWKKDQIKYSCP